MQGTITREPDVRRLTRPELERLGTPEAATELERRSAKRQERGKAYREKTDAEVQAALGDVLRMFETGDLPEAVAQTVIRRKESDVPMTRWSLLNQLIALANETIDARGPKQWEAAGRKVDDGARPFVILGPRTVAVKETDEATGDERVVGRRTVGFLGIPVYGIEDTSGDPVKAAVDYTPATFPPLFPAAERLGVTVRWAPFAGGALGWYAPGRDKIVLCSEDARTFFHELAHAAHERVVEAKGRRLAGGQDPGQEIVAETCAAVLCRLYGLDGYLYHGAEYVARYAAEIRGGDVRSKVARLLGDVQASLDLILEAA